MNKLLVSALAVFATTGVAVAQEAAQPSVFADSYVGITSNLDGDVDLTVGTGVTAFNQETYAEFTYSDGTTNSYSVSGGAVVDLSVVSLDTNVSYAWNNTTTDMIGWGDTNTWGDLSFNPTITATPGIIGGEYVSVGGNIDLDFDGGFGYEIVGGEIGVGYKHELGSGAHVDLGYVWAVDDSWDIGQGGMQLGVGFSF